MKQPCSVEVDGSSYRLLVDDAERVQALASALNQRLAGLGAAGSRTASPLHRLVAAALAMAEELQQAQHAAQAREQGLRQAMLAAQAELSGLLCRDGKRQLRQRLRSQRQAMPEGQRLTASQQVVQRLLGWPALRTSGWLAAFVAIDGEVDALAACLEAAGGRLALPRIDRERRQLCLHAYAPGDPLVRSAAGIAEPLAEAPLLDPAEMQLVVLPALAVDASGYRLGYGGGYYDRLLPQCIRAQRCALVYDFQLVDAVPHTAHDARVHWVITEGRLLRTDAPLPHVGSPVATGGSGHPASP